MLPNDVFKYVLMLPHLSIPQYVVVLVIVRLISFLHTLS